ncbi:hypothetical protein evm_009896 [Chilo suppressalis]|nr:hypothetical protein evm_009896 [Chilo suppressalis]
MKTIGYRRKVQNKYKEMINKSNVLLMQEEGSVEQDNCKGSVGFTCIQDVDIEDVDSICDINNLSGNECTTEDENDHEKDYALKIDLQKWSLKFNVPHASVNVLLCIYAGDAKPSNLDAYLRPFINEMKQLENGFTVTTKTETDKNMQGKIRAFICDSPARAMIKGVSNFNGKHGCLKCTVVGEYSHKSNIVTFSKLDCPKRNNEDFRNKKYGRHHKQDSPLLKLKIDMVEDILVSDSLHLIDLGVMKRLLIGWRDGNFGIYLTKWRAQDIKKSIVFW